MGKSAWRFFYYYFITPMILISAHVVAIFSVKVRKGLYPRYHSIQRMRNWVSETAISGKRILFHAASMGEFEHIKPLLKELKRKYNTINIITFFSPSAYENIKISDDFDFYLYMPFDTPANWKKIYDLLNPSLIILAKYDVWPAQVWMAKQHGIPLYLVNATLKETSSRTYFVVRNFLKYVYCEFNYIFAVSKEDTDRMLKNFPGIRVEVIGDTKYDQVIVRKDSALAKDLVPSGWIADHWILIAGSIWPEDEEHLLPALAEILEKYSKVKLIVVPHVPDDKAVNRLFNYFSKWGVILFSQVKKAHMERILIIDSVGLLAEIYKYAQLAYVGGSFKHGVHNVLEPAIYGIPVLYGPIHENSYEAIKLAENNGGLIVNNSSDILMVIESIINNENKRVLLGKKAEQYASRNTGATAKLLSRWENILGE